MDDTPVTDQRRPDRRVARDVLLLVGLCLVLFCLRLGGMALLNQDEGMHAATSKAMVQTGDWLTPRFNGESFYDKPALFNWLVAVCFAVLGFTELAARLPAALLGLGTVLVTYALGRRMFGRSAGLLAGAVLATSIEFIILSRFVVHDISLTFAQTLALASFFCALQAEDPSRRRWLLLCYAAAALAVLAKGPVGVALPALIVGLHLVVTRNWAMLRQTLLRPWGIVLFVVIALPWYIAMSLAHDDYVRLFLIEKNLGSFLGIGEPDHVEPFYYFVGVLFGGLFPWSCFLPVALVHAGGPPGRADRQPLRYLMIWLGLVFVFFSVAASKLPSYILPLFPAAALLIAYAWRDLVATPTFELRRGFVLSWLPLVALPLAGLVYVIVSGPPQALVDTFWVTGTQVMATVVLLVVGTALGFALFLARRHRAAFWSVVGTVVCFQVAVAGWIAPSLEPVRANRAIAERLDRMLPPGEKMAMFPTVIGVGDTALFYTDRQAVVVSPRDIRRQLREGNEPRYYLLKREDLHWLDKIRDRLHIVAEEGRQVIVSNRPLAPVPEP